MDDHTHAAISRRSSITLRSHEDEVMSGSRDGDGIPQCCCGRRDCAFRAHSCKLLEAVERDARTAGELGQVCYLSLFYSLLIAS